MAHTPTFETKNYPRSEYAEKVTWTCSCGKSGAVTDGRQPATLRRARSAFRRHLKAVGA